MFEDILEIINSALRVPDHGKLEPWRVILILEKSKEKFLHIIEARGKDLCIDEKKIEKEYIYRLHFVCKLLN